jgi:hypothetical protein
MTITIGSTTFENVSHDAGADVLYLQRGDPSTAADFGESPEATRCAWTPMATSWV